MPIFDYKCCKCGASFEELLRAREDDSVVRCPKCGADEVERQVSLFAAGSSGCSDSSPFT